MRHDAVGICFSDIKVIRAGEKHPRIHHKMKEDPVVLGHEVALTIVEAGENLRAQYQRGDRFIVQADIYINGQTSAYGYDLQGGFSRYAVIDWRVLAGDHGNYLIPIRQDAGYAELALCEPWACVEASYTVEYRTRWQDGGTVWLVGNGAGIRFGLASTWRPAKVVLDVSEDAFADRVRKWAQETGVEVVEGDDGTTRYDDIVILQGDVELAERVFARLANGGMFNVVLGQLFDRQVSVDIGRMHYDHLFIVGTDTSDLSVAYQPARTQLKAGRRDLGAGRRRPHGPDAFPARPDLAGQAGQDRGDQPARRTHGAGAQAVYPPGHRSRRGRGLPLAGPVRRRGELLLPQAGRDRRPWL